MRKLLPSRAASRTLFLAVPVLSLLVVIGGSGAAGAATVPTGATATIEMKLIKGQPKFVGPETVNQGDKLKIVNASDPKKIGPHTFSLVTQESLPKTKPERQKCFTPKGICLAIAEWQGLNKKEEITINPVKVGQPGWDTEGSLTEKGDSWFTEKKGASFTQIVSADATAAPKTLYFICAVHPPMQGKITVVAP